LKVFQHFYGVWLYMTYLSFVPYYSGFLVIAGACYHHESMTWTLKVLQHFYGVWQPHVYFLNRLH
jgi:hypothetical protein